MKKVSSKENTIFIRLTTCIIPTTDVSLNKGSHNTSTQWIMPKGHHVELFQ